MKKQSMCAVLSAICVSVGFYSCGHLPTSVKEEGKLEIRTRIITSGLTKSSSSLQTTFDSLIIQISASDMESIRISRKIDMSQPLITDTLTRIPAGTGREVNVYTVDKSGTVVHRDSAGVRTVRIDPDASTLLNAVLVPAAGSLYLQIGNIPTSVDSIIATFISSDNRAWGKHVKRSPKVYISIDQIPHLTRGVLGVAGVGTDGDTLYYAEAALTFNAFQTSSVNLSFETVPGNLEMSLAIHLPGATVVSGSMETGHVVTDEKGDLLITEIMYAANDSEYVEIYNPGSSTLEYDTLIVDVDGTYRIFTGITMAAGEYYVFGRQMFPWVDITHPVQNAFDLSSTGNWVTLRDKDSNIIDRVIFAGGSNGLEWPSVSGKKSIELDPSSYDAASNNYGRNWTVATSVIESTFLYGTPGNL